MTDVNPTPRYLTEDPRARAEIRRYGFSTGMISAEDAATAEVIATAADNEAIELSSIVFTNNGGSNVNINLYIATGTPSNSDRVLVGTVLLGGELLQLRSTFMINPGQSLYVSKAGTGNLWVAGWLTAYL